jgi:hypothetical protein
MPYVGESGAAGAAPPEIDRLALPEQWYDALRLAHGCPSGAGAGGLQIDRSGTPPLAGSALSHGRDLDPYAGVRPQTAGESRIARRSGLPEAALHPRRVLRIAVRRGIVTAAQRRPPRTVVLRTRAGGTIRIVYTPRGLLLSATGASGERARVQKALERAHRALAARAISAALYPPT